MERPDFSIVANLYYEDLYRFAFSLARNPDDAADLTQQAFVVYATKGGQIREVPRIKNWLFTTLYREFLRMRARASRYESLDAPENTRPEAVTQSVAGRDTETSGMLEALASLDESHRSILSLFYLDQVSYKEIAEILDIPIGTVMSRLSRAKEHLRRKLELSSGSKEIRVIRLDSHQSEKQHNG